MSQFEYLFVLISIVTGLALTRLLSGVTLAFTRKHRRSEPERLLFSLAIIVVMLAVWWSSFRWADREVWTFFEYTLLCVYISMFYAMAAILHPNNAAEDTRFEDVRTPFYLTFIVYQFVEWLVVYVRDGDVSVSYLILVLHLNVLAGIGIFLRNQKYDLTLALWLLLTALAWAAFFRMLG
jgi:hypothetical protein